jgi:hypothetical protein
MSDLLVDSAAGAHRSATALAGGSSLRPIGMSAEISGLRSVKKTDGIGQCKGMIRNKNTRLA